MFKYYIDMQPHYMLDNGESLTQQQLDEINQRHYDKGYSDRMHGYYDKWYRYNTFDDGSSYDKGCMTATSNIDCPNECTIIECLN